MNAKPRKTTRKPANTKKLTRREQKVIANYRNMRDWLLALSDDDYNAYLVQPFEARVAQFKAMPFYLAI